MTAIYVRNRLPTKSLKSGLTPYEGWFGKPASYENLRVWGCVAYAQVPQEKRKKLDKTARKCIFIGYTMTATQYRLYDPEKKVVFTARDVVFEESKSYYPTDTENGGVRQRYYAPEVQPWEEKVAWGDEFDEEEADAELPRVSRVKEKEKKRAVRVEEPEEEQLVDLAGFDEGENVYMESQPRFEVMGPPAMPGHFGKPPQREKEQWMVKGLRSDGKSSFWKGTPGVLPEATSQLRSKPHRSASVSFANYAMLTTVYMVEDGPRNYRKAMESEEAEEWQKAVDSECASLSKNKVLQFVDAVPTGKKVIPTRLILQGKLGPTGETVRYKARLVAQGFRQIEGEDFTHTFAPVASLSSVRVVLSIAAARGFKIYQMDVVTAFLGSKLEEEVYVSLPEGILGNTRVASLNRSLYGLKQSPRCWYTTIDAFLIGEMGFRRGRFDCCIYTDERGSVLALYVDDILITGTSKNIYHIRQQLKAKFEMVDLGPVSHFLGMVITREEQRRQIYVSQQGYIDRVLETFAMTECKPVATPIDKDKPGPRMGEENCRSRGS